MGGFGGFIGPASHGTQWTNPPQRHRNSLDDDLDGASGDGDGREPGRLARFVARIRRRVRR